MSSRYAPITAETFARIVAHDGSLFSDDPVTADDIERWMGWTTLASEASALIPRLTHLADEVISEGITDVVLLGMGGSSLAPLVLSRVIGRAPGSPRLHVLDTSAPTTVQTLLDTLDPARTWWLVSSKSGSTIEPNTLYAIFRESADVALGQDVAGRHFLAVTDPGSSLEALAHAEGFRDVFHGKPDVGGRFSALSAFGLVPAALIGLDLVRFIEIAGAAEVACATGGPALTLATSIASACETGADKLVMATPQNLSTLGLWIEQLVGESLGKGGHGLVPVIRPDFAGAPLRHTPDSIEVPLEVSSPYDIAAALITWEWATAALGASRGVHPFNQPDVEAAKAETATLLMAATPERSPDTDLESLAGQAFGHLAPGDYLAILAYLPDDDKLLSPLVDCSAEIADRLGVAVCLELGPRYLHSTGQLHKGGANNGVFLVVTTADATDVAVPGRDWTLRDLHHAQADGDAATLSARGRRVVRVTLPDAGAESVESLVSAIRSAVAQLG